tara:strand:+ start:14118 stop:14549 length:432 start_codon:yes stop_codon:yes gene_type:complete
MSNFKYTAGLNNVGSYQVSGAPFVSSSIECHDGTGPVKITFPYVTRWIIVQNNSVEEIEDLKVGFSSLGITAHNNFFTVYNRQAAINADRSSIIPRLELKLTEIYLTGSSNAEVIAGLTNIPVERINNISPSGSNWSGSSGVG